MRKKSKFNNQGEIPKANEFEEKAKEEEELEENEKISNNNKNKNCIKLLKYKNNNQVPFWYFRWRRWSQR